MPKYGEVLQHELLEGLGPCFNGVGPAGGRLSSLKLRLDSGSANTMAY